MKTAAALLLLGLTSCTHFVNEYMRDAAAPTTPIDGEAVVVVYRPSTFGGNTQFPIFEFQKGEGTLMGFAESGCYFEYRVPAGRHVFLTWGEGYAYIEADLAPKKIYYIRCYAELGFIAPRPRFDPVNAGTDEWTKLEADLKGLKLRELDTAKAAPIEDSKEEQAKKAKARIDEGKKAPTYLRPEDGR